MDPDLLVIWGGILAVIIVVNLFIYLNRRSRYRLLEKLAEKGPLSPELLAGLSTGNNHSRSDAEKRPITSGIFLMCIGIALAVFFWAMQDFGLGPHIGWLPVIGIFPFMVGLARILGAAFDKRPSP